MVLDERSRHHLYLQLEAALGPEAAATLMEHLPPVGWADVATKRDVDALGNQLRAEFHKETKGLLTAIVGVNVGLASLAFAAASLT